MIPFGTRCRILVMRLSSMGDVALTVPVLKSLRQYYPDAEIHMLTPAFLQPFFREVEGIQFVTPDFKGRHKGKRGMFKLASDLERFDYVADLHDVIRTKILRRTLHLRGSEVAYIDKGREEKKALTTLYDKKRVQLKTVVERYREVFTRLGFNFPEIAPLPAVRYEMSPAVLALTGNKSGEEDAHPSSAKKRWIGVAPFAQHAGKIYGLSNMTEVIGFLSGLANTKVFVFGGGKDEQIYGESIEKLYPNVVSVIGKIKLTQEMELISNLDLMLSMDSSGMHMASLVGVPVVSIWGATHPYAGFYGLGQDPENIVQLDMWCRPCSIYGNKPCEFDQYACMMNLRPTMVVNKVLAFFGEKPINALPCET